MSRGVVLFILISIFLTNKGFCQDSIQANYSFAKNAEFFSKGLEYKYNENHDKAIIEFEKAIKVYPDDHASMYELSVLYRIKGMNDKGFDMIQKAVELDSTNKWYKIRLADFYKIKGDFNAFIDIYEELIYNEPNNINYLEVYFSVLWMTS